MSGADLRDHHIAEHIDNQTRKSVTLGVHQPIDRGLIVG